MKVMPGSWAAPVFIWHSDLFISHGDLGQAQAELQHTRARLQELLQLQRASEFYGSECSSYGTFSFWRAVASHCPAAALGPLIFAAYGRLFVSGALPAHLLGPN